MLGSLFFIIASVWSLLAIFLYIFQSHYIYFPEKKLVTTPAAIQLNYEEVVLRIDENTDIYGWWIPHSEAHFTLLFLHGNAGNISHRLESIALFHDMKLSVLIIDYQGYGLSDGKPGEEGTYLDAEAAWNYLVDEKQINPDNIIIFGRSLGGAVATWLATQVTPGALILESTFTSIVEIAKHYYPYLPVSIIARIHYPSIERITSVSSPLLIIHSQDDDVIPYAHGRRLFDTSTGNKTFLDINGNHNNGFLTSGIDYTNGIRHFIERLTKK